MKIGIFIVGLVTLFVLTNGVFVPPRHKNHKIELVGSKQCTWGPSYWCQNLTSAADCHATKHCIQSVWIHQELPPDSSSVCQTCLDMVKQARDQLLSNETQELIKQVFEGSCHLLRIKPIVKECDKIADDYIPDLIDTLASQMNPQVVCSVAGLCNNARIHRMIEEEADKVDDSLIYPKPNLMSTCDGCHTVVDLMENKLKQATRDDVLQGFLQACGKLGSFSDACSNLIVTYFTEIYDYLMKNFNSGDVCLLAGQCTAQFHTHASANVEITPNSDVGYVNNRGKDDLPCELCEQLVQHLRELLVANTTESEFKLVLEGLCKQTQGFKQECLSLVDQYYALAYQFLVSELNGTVACGLIGICPNTEPNYNVMPLLPVSSIKQKQPLLELTAENAQLPIELLVPPHTQKVVYNEEVCAFCQYFLHYVQQQLTEPKTEDKIKKIIDEACERMPKEVTKNCEGFVETYEPALVAILAQEIDPSTVCPLIRACPSSKNEVEVFMQEKSNPKCPLCLYAVTELESLIKDKKTEENIRASLSKLCTHLSSKMSDECKDFIATYTDELVEMMVADFKPNEVCVYLKMCDAKSTKPVKTPVIGNGDVETNIITDFTYNGQTVVANVDLQSNGPQCVICQFVMKELDDQLKDNKTDDEIKKTVHRICNVMPKSVSKECNDFVNQYADSIIQMLIAAMEPKDICAYLNLCDREFVETKVEIFDCAICEVVVKAVDKILANPKVDHSVEHVMEKACRAIPKRNRQKCVQLIEDYGTEIIRLVLQYGSNGIVCRSIGMCAADAAQRPIID